MTLPAPAPPGPAAPAVAVVVQPGSLADRLRNQIRDGLIAYDRSRPRNQQAGIGASDLGHPCLRYLAYRATGAPRFPQRSDPWPAMVGTACHDGPLATAFRDGDWEVGKSMEIGPGIRGTLDVYHKPSKTVVDYKVLGADSLRSLRTGGPRAQYRTQVHAYGFGLWRLGVDVENVAIVGLPRSGFLRDLVVWTEPYDVNVVEQAFQRWYTLAEAAPALAPEHFTLLARVDGPCAFCNWFNPALAAEHPELACPGVGG